MWSCVGIGAVVEGANFRYGVFSVPVCFWGEVGCLFGVVCVFDRVRLNLWCLCGRSLCVCLCVSSCVFRCCVCVVWMGGDVEYWMLEWICGLRGRGVVCLCEFGAGCL